MSESVWSVRIAWKRYPSWSGEAPLRAGVRALAAHDQPGGLLLLTLGGQIDAVGDLRDLAVLSL